MKKIVEEYREALRKTIENNKGHDVFEISEDKVIMNIAQFHNFTEYLPVKFIEATEKRVLKEVLIGLKNIEEKADKLNGNKGNLCLFCDIDKHDCMGIIHKDDCLIIDMRKLIRYFEQNTERS